MLKGNNIQQSNGLLISVDWLSFTVDFPSVNPVISFLGYSLSDFRQLPKGINGYRSQLRHSAYPISIQYEGNDNMGIHVDISGSAVQDFIDHYQAKHTSSTPFGTDAYHASSFDLTVFVDFLNDLSIHGHVTRLDLAVDDIGCRYFDLPELSSIFSSGSFISRFREWKELVKYQNGSERIGHTIYLGSRASSVMVRIYDKQMEQNGKLLENGELPVMFPWIRWELELKEDRARQACDLIREGYTIGQVSVGILSNYLRIIQLDHSRKDRCSSLPKWSDFLDGIPSLSLYRPSEPKTINDIKSWLSRQVAPSIATVIASSGGSLDYVIQLAVSGSKRLSAHQIDLIEKETGCSA